MALKRRLVAAGVLLTLAVGAAAGGAWLDYLRLAQRAEALKAEMTKIFRATVPGDPVVVDVPLQMAAKVQEMEERVRLIGTEGSQSPLAVLQEISRRTPEDIAVDLRDFNYGPDGIRLEGVTGSFEATNRMANALTESPLFREVLVADAKMSLEGNQVEFRMTVSFSEKQVRP